MSDAGFFDPGTGEYVVLDGNVIERKSLYLVEKIKDYDENIEVLCVDPDRADSPFEEPFQIAEWVNGELKLMFGVWELNDSVYERIVMYDSHRGVDLEKIVSDHNAKVKAEQAAKAAEKAAARQDLVASIANSKTSKFTFKRDADDALVTVFEDRPAEVRHAE